jgi:hypothetical protein
MKNRKGLIMRVFLENLVGWSVEIKNQETKHILVFETGFVNREIALEFLAEQLNNLHDE